MMKKLIIGLFALLPTFVMAAGPSVPLMDANNDLTDKASLTTRCSVIHELLS